MCKFTMVISEFKFFVNPEQKKCPRMKEVVKNVLNPRSLVLRSSARTFSAATDCMLLPKKRLVIDCEIDPSYVTKTMPHLFYTYGPQIMGRQSDKIKKGICSYGEELVETMEAIGMKDYLVV